MIADGVVTCSACFWATPSNVFQILLAYLPNAHVRAVQVAAEYMAKVSLLGKEQMNLAGNALERGVGLSKPFRGGNMKTIQTAARIRAYKETGNDFFTPDEQMS